MAQEIDFETRERCEEMYVVDGLTFEQVAMESGVSKNTLQNWSNAEGWRDKREEYRKNKSEIRSTMMKLRKKLADEAAANPDPQKIFAFIRLEALVEKKERKAEPVQAKIDRPAFFMEDIEFIASFLKDADPEGLKVLAKNFDGLIDSFKAKYSQN